ncbi:hypothetical protein HFP64_28140 [Bacillus sp. AC79A.1]|uniref:hypothetical protein n=1 Tax=Bacillus wiedmannii TaxID=1890302 RepID=UPI000BFC06DA|nr:hypothetical protein [Bacillus wiedmannii]PHF04982.1 hypothetical protein COF74_27055 [Bacillus wiedmannii]
MSKKDKFAALLGNKNKETEQNKSSVHNEIINAHNPANKPEIAHNFVQENENIHEYKNEPGNKPVSTSINILEIAKKAKKIKPKTRKIKPVYKTRTFRIREDLLEAIDMLYTEHGEKQDMINNLLIEHFENLSKNMK